MALGKIQLRQQGVPIDIKVYDPSTEQPAESTNLRVKTPNGVGFIPLVDPSNTANHSPIYYRVKTSDGIKALAIRS